MKTLNGACETFDNLSQHRFGADSRGGEIRLREKGLNGASKPQKPRFRQDNRSLKCSILERRAGNSLVKKSWLGLGTNTYKGIYVSTGKTPISIGLSHDSLSRSRLIAHTARHTCREIPLVGRQFEALA